jgi:phosphopantothenoylcysteine decarboxylase / phosphopantothenate---cysteine ligase
MKIVLGVGGGIAAYKAAELARALQERGATVETVMTRAAQQFITPLTFAALTNRKVITDLFAGHGAEEVLSSAVEHIRVAQENSALVVAPATADLLGQFANGLAGDFLTTLFLAFTGKVILAPAMNSNMWAHPAVQANVALLRARGCDVVEPDSGLLACGTTGPGRLAEPAAIADRVVAALQRKQDLAGETLVMTAGPTREAIDPVRYITNRSSGKMGYAVAEAAAARGARVVLVSGPVTLAAPVGVELVRVESAREMRDAVFAHLDEATILLKAAAVADYHVAQVPEHKIKKTAARLTLDLDPTPDILAELGRAKGDRLLIGFAAETRNVAEEARRKLKVKNCDMVVGNLVSAEASQAGTGFEADENQVTLVLASGENIELPRATKKVIAGQILDQVLRLRRSA